MENNQSYFGELGHGVKTLLTGMKITWKEYFKDFFTNKSTEQYPENRKTTLHVAKRHRGRLVFKLSLIIISEHKRRTPNSYAVFCLNKKNICTPFTHRFSTDSHKYPLQLSQNIIILHAFPHT